MLTTTMRHSFKFQDRMRERAPLAAVSLHVIKDDDDSGSAKALQPLE